MRSIRSELLSILMVLAVPLSMLLIFPFESIGFKAKVHNRRVGLQTAFISLSAEQYDLAMDAIKSSWRKRGLAMDTLGVDLSVGELPPMEYRLALPKLSKDNRSSMPIVERDQTPYLPSLKADKPMQITREVKFNSTPVFAREEFLKID